MEDSLELLRVLAGQDCFFTHPAEDETKEVVAFVVSRDNHELRPVAEGTQPSTHRVPGRDDHLIKEIYIMLRNVSVQYPHCRVLRAASGGQYRGFHVLKLQVEPRGAGMLASMNRPEKSSQS